MKTILTICALAICGAFTLQAAEGGKGKKPEGKKPEGGKPGAPMHTPEEYFKKLDTNNDGFLSKEEFLASPFGKKEPAKAEERFKKLDKDGDGKVSLEEFKAGGPPKHGDGPKKPEAN